MTIRFLASVTDSHISIDYQFSPVRLLPVIALVALIIIALARKR